MIKGRQIVVVAAIIATLVLVFTLLPACKATPTPTPTPSTPTPSPPTPTPSPPTPTPTPQPVKLMFSHFEPPSGTTAVVFVPFAEEVEEKTGGRVTFEHALAGALGPTKEQYDLAVTGVADISYIGSPYTPGRFPMLSVAELPIRCPSGETTTRALMELMKKGYFDEEFHETKLLAVWTTSPIQFQWTNKRVSSLADLKGLKIRSATSYWSGLVSKLGLVPVEAPVTEVYGMMEKGIVDGVGFPWNGMVTWKSIEITKYLNPVDLIYFPFALAMNKQTWDKLPADVQTIIEEVAEKYSYIAGKEHDTRDAQAKEDFAKLGGEVISFSEADWDKIRELMAPAYDEWIKTTEAKGLPATQALADLESSFKKLGIEEPFVR